MPIDPLSPSLSSNSFRSRRSHPNLNHISLAPLTSRIPLDDDADADYFSSLHGEDDSAPFGSRSYLSSISVPSTPGILSHSRSSSRTGLARRNRSSIRVPLSETDLDEIGGAGAGQPLHHQQLHRQSGHQHHRSLDRHNGNNRQPRPKTTSRQDSEWLLRAGLALATTTREEKGQSWLIKRESSTNLLADVNPEDELSKHKHKHSRHASRSGKSRSGHSTPATSFSRRPSRSRGGSRRGSRADLAMTATAAEQRHKRGSHSIDTDGLEPDFVDEDIRAEMASISPPHRTPSSANPSLRRSFLGEGEGADGYDSDPDSTYSSSSTGSEDEVDEAEMQRLTRERGFGLGSWVDRLVEWTLFTVEDEVPAAVASARESLANSEVPRRIRRRVEDLADQNQGQSQNENRDHGHDRRDEAEHEAGRDGADDDGHDDDDSLAHAEDATPMEKPGEQGGWADIGWFLRAAGNAVL